MMKKIKLIALIGKAGAGKDFWLRRICEDDERVHEIISCTTRPARVNEKNNINYHFLSEEQFQNEVFIEWCHFNNWYYGTRYSDLDENKINIGVFNLNGVESLLKSPDIDLSVIYFEAEDKVRLIRQLKRDASDIEEIFRRYLADKEDFKAIRLNMIENQLPNNYWVIDNSINDSYDSNYFILQEIDEIIDKVKNK